MEEFVSLGQAVAPLVGILFLAAMIESIVEYFARPIVARFYAQFLPDKKAPDSLPALKYVSAAVGVFVAIVYNADLLAYVDMTASLPYVGQVLTGLLIGRGANFVSDFVGRWIAKPK